MQPSRTSIPWFRPTIVAIVDLCATWMSVVHPFERPKQVDVSFVHWSLRGPPANLRAHFSQRVRVLQVGFDSLQKYETPRSCWRPRWSELEVHIVWRFGNLRWIRSLGRPGRRTCMLVLLDYLFLASNTGTWIALACSSRPTNQEPNGTIAFLCLILLRTLQWTSVHYTRTHDVLQGMVGVPLRWVPITREAEILSVDVLNLVWPIIGT